jgi:hypothetical protein
VHGIKVDPDIADNQEFVENMDSSFIIASHRAPCLCIMVTLNRAVEVARDALNVIERAAIAFACLLEPLRKSQGSLRFFVCRLPQVCQGFLPDGLRNLWCGRCIGTYAARVRGRSCDGAWERRFLCVGNIMSGGNVGTMRSR